MRRWLPSCCLALAASVLLQTQAHADLILAESHFNSSTNGVEGWQGIDTGGTLEALLWVSDAASGGGYISMRETKGDGQEMEFYAPAAFLGDKRLAYGGGLSYRMRQHNTDQLYYTPNIVLQSGSTRLTFGSWIPLTTWSSYYAPLNENAGWVLAGTSQPASKDQLLSVLSALDQMRIRAEFSNRQVEQTDFDDVVLSAGPPNLSSRLVATGQIEVFWPASFTNCTLEASDQLSAGVAWQRITNSVALRGSENVVSVEPSGPVRFFRLATQ